MSSIFEAPASKPTGSGLKIAAAFGAGVAVTFAVTQLLPPDFSNVAQTLARAPQQLAAATPPKAAIEAAAAKTDTAPPAETNTPALTTASISPATDDVCAQRAWPYTDKNCAEADTNTGAATPVRVIPTDKSAAAVAAAPTPADMKIAAPQAGDSLAAKAASVAPPLPTRKATIAVAPDDAAAAPLPPRRETTDRSTPASATGANPTARQKQEPRNSANGTREVTGSRVREPDASANEARARTATQRTVDPPDEADEESHASQGFSVVRRGTLPDGRRVTVYRKVEGDDGVVSQGENYRVRRVLVSPFGNPEGN